MFGSMTALVVTVTALPALTIRVHVAESVPQAVVASALNEASDIWRCAGVEFNWQLAGGEYSALRVIIEDGPAPKNHRNKRRMWMMGRIVFEEPETNPTIHLRHGLMTALLWQIEGAAAVTGMTLITRHRAVGRALGRILAHELGHYLLGPNSHTTNGLMRPQWQPEELFAVRRQPVSVDIDEMQKHRVAARLRQLDGSTRERNASR